MKSSKFIAVEIGADGVGVAGFARSASGQIELLDFGFAAFDAAAPTEMAKEAVVAATLKRLLAQKKLSGRMAVLSLDGQAMFSRRVVLPPVAPKKRKQTLHHEAVQHIPFPIGEVVWDHQLGSGGEALLVAVKADLAEGMAQAVQATGLAVGAVGVAPVALSNAVRHTHSDFMGTTLVVDFGAHSSNLIFIEGDHTFFRTLPVAGHQMSRMIQEIGRSVVFYRNQQEGGAPERVLLTGDLRGLDDPAGKLAEELKLPVEIFDPLEKVKVGAKAESAAGQPLGVLVGLAVGHSARGALEINLMPESLRKARGYRRRQPLMVACIAVAALMAGAGAAGLSYLTRLGEWELDGVTERVAALEQIEQQLVPLEREAAEFENRSRVYRTAIERRTVWLEALLDLRERLSTGMFLLAAEPLHEGDALVGMRITVVSYLDREPEGVDAVIQLRDGLRASEWFSEKTRVSSRPTKERFVRRFGIDLFFEEHVTR